MRRGGFSLVESVFSISLIALVIMFVLNLFPTSSVAVHRAHEEAAAQSFAQSALESLHSEPFGALEPGSSTLPTQTSDGIKYTITRDIYLIPGEDAASLKGARISVAWTDRNINHHLALEGYLGNLQR